MRIACIHVPQFALQCATRLDPSLRGAAVAVVGGFEPHTGRHAGSERSGPLHAPVVVACSRAAWAAGVRLGMTAPAAYKLSPDIKVVSAEAAIERETVRAIADAALDATRVVDIGGRIGAGGAHLAMYAEVPAKIRGTSFGERLLDQLDGLGLTGRIGIADDRFAAWVAAAHGGGSEVDPHSTADRGVVSVPRGGSAAFLAPRPLSLLAITAEVQHMLEALGVRTLGEFAALPAPSVARPLEADYQALARGDSGTRLWPYVPEAPIREELVVTSGNVLERAGCVGGPTAIAMVARRIALRLAGRGRAAARLEVCTIASGAVRETTQGQVQPPAPFDEALTDADSIARVLSPVVDASTDDGPWRLRVVVAGEAVVGEPLESVRPATIYATAAVDPLSVVLSTSASLFMLSPPTLRSERRDAHRRTKRGKQRRGRPTPLAQSRLFDRSSS